MNFFVPEFMPLVKHWLEIGDCRSPCIYMSLLSVPMSSLSEFLFSASLIIHYVRRYRFKLSPCISLTLTVFVTIICWI